MVAYLDGRCRLVRRFRRFAAPNCGVCFSTTWRALAFIQQIRSTQPKDVYKILAYILKER